jgi:hypothetical protein
VEPALYHRIDRPDSLREIVRLALGDEVSVEGCLAQMPGGIRSPITRRPAMSSSDTCISSSSSGSVTRRRRRCPMMSARTAV